METEQILGISGRPSGRLTAERCRECRGTLVESGGEVACANCGVVARREEVPSQGATKPTTSRAMDNRLGSFMGTIEEERSQATFNGTSSLGYIKSVSDHMGEDHDAFQCASLIQRVAEKLSLPAFVAENASVLARRVLAERRSKGESGRRRRDTVPTIAAYCLLAACRTARLNRVSAKSVMQAFSDLGRRVTKSGLLSVGLDSKVPLRPADPAGLVATVVGALQSNGNVLARLERHAVEPHEYFHRLTEMSAVTVGKVRGMRGASPRTVAASSVYLASREMEPKAFTQLEAAEALDMAEYSIREFCCWARGVLAPGRPGPLKAEDR